MMRSFLPRLLLTVALPVGVAAVLVNVLAKDPDLRDPQAMIRSAWGANMPARAKAAYATLIRACPTNVALHRSYISAHFEIPLVQGKNDVRDDTSIIAEYDCLATTNDAVMRDIGNYGGGFICIHKRQYDQALARYAADSNRAMPCLNNSTGNLLMERGDDAAAIPWLLRELAVTGNVDGAYFNLARCYFRTGQYQALRDLFNTPAARDHLPLAEAKFVALSSGRLHQYVGQVLTGQFRNVTPAGLLAALIILAGWFLFLRRLDVFEPEHMRWLLVALGLGVFAALVLSDFGYDTAYFLGGLQLTGRPLHDLLYCIFCIGLIEETVKFLPFLVLLLWSRQVNEAIDCIIYASVVALGFAFTENIQYFDFLSYTSFHGRAMSAVVLHMALSSLAVYGIMYARCRRPARPWVPIAGFFALAVVLHGLYDYWLVGEGMLEALRMLSFLMLLLIMVLYRRMIANALNQSVFWTDKTRQRIVANGWLLTYMMTAVVIFEYVMVAWHFGRTNANLSFTRTLLSSWILTQYIALGLGVIQLQRGAWIGLVNKGDFIRRTTPSSASPT